MNDPEIIALELGPLRAALELLAERGMTDLSDDRCSQISSVMRVTLCDLTPEECAGVYAAMLLKALPEAPTDG